MTVASGCGQLGAAPGSSAGEDGEVLMAGGYVIGVVTSTPSQTGIPREPYVADQVPGIGAEGLRLVSVKSSASTGNTSKTRLAAR